MKEPFECVARIITGCLPKIESLKPMVTPPIIDRCNLVLAGYKSAAAGNKFPSAEIG